MQGYGFIEPYFALLCCSMRGNVRFGCQLSDWMLEKELYLSLYTWWRRVQGKTLTSCFSATNGPTGTVVAARFIQFPFYSLRFILLFLPVIFVPFYSVSVLFQFYSCRLILQMEQEQTWTVWVNGTLQSTKHKTFFLNFSSTKQWDSSVWSWPHQNSRCLQKIHTPIYSS